jgi:hypothetical protein
MIGAAMFSPRTLQRIRRIFRLEQMSTLDWRGVCKLGTARMVFALRPLVKFMLSLVSYNGMDVVSTVLQELRVDSLRIALLFLQLRPGAAEQRAAAFRDIKAGIDAS